MLILTRDTHCVYYLIMIKKLIQHGNSAALVIDKALLDLLNVKIDTPLEITTDGKNIIVSPQTIKNGEEMILSALEKINQKHSNVLRRLAK
jgi:antitoxin component of MazEF toxin-antitoxin module